MLTSVDQSLANTSYRDLGIDAQLIKPARSSVLLETLVATIQRHRHTTDAPVQQLATERLNAPQRPPLAPSEQRAQLQPPPVRPRLPATGDGGHRLDILVAEDNEVNQMVFTQILGETGYGFEIVGNGRKALDAFGKLNPCMILMDVSMPEMSGLEATAAIRRLEEETGAACADRRRYRACAQGRSRTLPGGGYGRLSAQADQPQGPARESRALDRRRQPGPSQRGIASRRRVSGTGSGKPRDQSPIRCYPACNAYGAIAPYQSGAQSGQ